MTDKNETSKRYREQPDNLLPCDGTVRYYGVAIPQACADNYHNQLLTGIEWKHDEAMMFGKHIVTKRKAAWYADESFEYTYSNVTKRALPWTKTLIELKTIIEKLSGEKYNSCLLNLYHTGAEGMAWHSDGEKDLKKEGAIASLSFGAERRFSFKHKSTKEKISLMLAHGSLLVMSGTTQAYWQHCLPQMKRVPDARVNLTFRSIESTGA